MPQKREKENIKTEKKPEEDIKEKIEDTKKTEEGEEKPKEKKKEKKSQKDRPKSKKKHTKVQIWKLYGIDGNTLKRKNEQCPRCGAGIFLAKYKNRKYCGKCGWSQTEKIKDSS